MTKSRPTEQQLSKSIADTSKQVVVGGHYAHYKQQDHTYIVRAIAVREDDDELCVIYEAEYGERLTFVRPVASWNQTVVVNGVTMSRFRRVS